MGHRRNGSGSGYVRDEETGRSGVRTWKGKGRLAVCNLSCDGLSGTSVSTDVALRKIYVGRLSPDVTSETLLRFFIEHGEIEEGSVAYDKETNKSCGFGSVTYKTADAAMKAINDSDKRLGVSAVVLIAITVPAGFTQPVKPQAVSASPVSYAPNLHAMLGYPASYPNIPAQYPPPPHVSYTQVNVKKDPIGFPAPTPTSSGISLYPYYSTRP